MIYYLQKKRKCFGGYKTIMYFCKRKMFSTVLFMKLHINIRSWIFALLILCPVFAYAQEGGKLLQAWKKLQVRLDSATVRKYDPQYIQVPEKPWRIVLRGRTSDFNMDVNSYMDETFLSEKIGEEVTEGRFDWSLNFNPPVAQSVGFYAGYRGLGFSYSYYLLKKTGRSFAFSLTGARYGLNFRLRRFSTNDVGVNATIQSPDAPPVKMGGAAHSPDPIWVRSVIIDGYYLFNGRRFSQAAAYNQSVIQKRSAGSLMLGAMYHQSSLDLATNQNAMLVMLNGDWGKISIRQFDVGVGYGYNWVPGRGWLINVMLMPTVSVYNRIKTHYYDSNYSIFADEETEGNHKPLFNDDDDDDDYDDEDDVMPDDMELWETRAQTKSGKVQLNIDTRASITYNWSRYFVNVFGQLNSFDYGSSRTDVNLTDWYVRASFGVRF